ncbi:MAG: hypothetical protein WCP69_06850 [Bacteroidota bacterium]
MKTSIKLFLLISILTVSSSLSFAQKKGKPFAGTIKYALTYDGVEASQLAQMPTATTTTISGNKQKVTLDMGQYAVITITDGDDESFVFYIDMMGQKFAYRLNKEAIAKEKENDKAAKPTVTKSEETKEIAGFKCKKATSVTKNEETGDETSTIVWYTEEIVVGDKFDFMGENEGIKGVTLGTESTSGKMVRKSYATEVKKEKVKDTDFLIPADAKEMTKEEFMKMLGGGGGEE